MKTKSFHFLFLPSLLSLLVNIFLPLFVALPALAIDSPTQTSTDISLHYETESHNLMISVPANRPVSEYQLTYQHLVDQELVTERVQGSLHDNNDQETATVFLGTESSGQPVPHEVTGGTVTISPENIQRSFIIAGDKLWYADNDGNDLAPLIL